MRRRSGSCGDCPDQTVPSRYGAESGLGAGSASGTGRKGGAGDSCPAAVPVGSQVTAAAPEETRREERKPEKAAPGDLQQVKREWKMIVGQSEGMFKQMLLTASPKYNGSTGEGKLYVEFTNPLAANYVR